MNWAIENWAVISAAVLAIVRVLESIKVIQDNKQAVTIIGIIKEVLTFR
jgi:hypothetical protein